MPHRAGLIAYNGRMTDAYRRTTINLNRRGAEAIDAIRAITFENATEAHNMAAVVYLAVLKAQLNGGGITDVVDGERVQVRVL